MAMLILIASCGQVFGETLSIPERRRTQFQTEAGYAFVPIVFDIPGVGKGYGVFGAASNIGGSHTDVVGSVFGGDVFGEAIGINEIHIVPKHLILDIGAVNLSSSSVQNYSQRGMASNKDDYTTVEFGNTNFNGFRLTATFVERRYEVYGGYYSGSTQIKSLLDRNGNIIIDAQNAKRNRPSTFVWGGRVDLTDDYRDPRRGLDIDISRWNSPPADSGPDFYFVDISTTAYVPIGKRSTWAFNYFRSDAYMQRTGETNPTVIEQNLGLDCAQLTDPETQRLCLQVIDTTIAANTYGTATSLGGLSRLRSYPEGRFSGAHTEFFGTELRWNLTDESTPFNIFIMKDIRTAIQVALFYEVGSIADNRADLWHITRDSYGAGFRVVTASGLVYRIDLASGYEGFQPSIFFDYPWQL
ncbi:MAG: hypothetical protein ACHQYP_09105 [Nitrospiria bacterium]